MEYGRRQVMSVGRFYKAQPHGMQSVQNQSEHKRNATQKQHKRHVVFFPQ